MRLWRVFLVLAAAGILIGGPMHPKGEMVDMLANPSWVPGHTLLLVGLIALLVGLILFRRNVQAGTRTAKWARLSVFAATLQVIEMGLHDAAVVDQQHLALGQPTPVLTTHLWLAVFVYPVFAAVLSALLVAGARERTLGSRWINWVGIIGLIGHGLSAPLVVAAHVPGAGALFPLLAIFGLWIGLAGIWPTRENSVTSPLGISNA